MKKGMDVTIDGHRAWVEYIKGQPALEPWHPEPELVVWLGIDSPHAISGFGITLPLKEYPPEELKRLIEEEGTRQFKDMIARHDAEREKNEAQQKREEEADEVARKVSEAAQVAQIKERG